MVGREVEFLFENGRSWGGGGGLREKGGWIGDEVKTLLKGGEGAQAPLFAPFAELSFPVLGSFFSPEGGYSQPW